MYVLLYHLVVYRPKLIFALAYTKHESERQAGGQYCYRPGLEVGGVFELISSLHMRRSTSATQRPSTLLNLW